MEINSEYSQRPNALLSGGKLLAKIARNEASQLFSVRLSNLLAVFSSVKEICADLALGA